jgi:hypothetical protein
LTGAICVAGSTLAGGGCGWVPGLSGSYTFSLALTAIANGVRYSTQSVYSVRAFYNDPLNPGEPWAAGGLQGRTLIIDAGAGGALLMMLGGVGGLLPYPTLAAPIELIPFLLPLANDPTVVPDNADLTYFERRKIGWKKQRILMTRPLSLLAATRRLPPATPIPDNLYPAFVWLPDGSTLDGFRLLDRPHLQEATNVNFSSVQMDISPAHGKPDLTPPNTPWFKDLEKGPPPFGLGDGDFLTGPR